MAYLMVDVMTPDSPTVKVSLLLSPKEHASKCPFAYWTL